MRVPKYMNVSKPYLKDGQILVRVGMKRWGIFPLAWRLAREKLDLPWYYWPYTVALALMMCFGVMSRGFEGEG